MNEKFNKNVKFEQLTKMFLSRGEEKGLIVKDPFSPLSPPASIPPPLARLSSLPSLTFTMYAPSLTLQSFWTCHWVSNWKCVYQQANSVRRKNSGTQWDRTRDLYKSKSLRSPSGALFPLIRVTGFTYIYTLWVPVNWETEKKNEKKRKKKKRKENKEKSNEKKRKKNENKIVRKETKQKKKKRKGRSVTKRNEMKSTVARR